MKNKNTSRKRQFFSAGVYVALAAVVVAVSVNTTVGLLSNRWEDLPDTTPDNISIELPELAELPEIVIPELSVEPTDTVLPDAAPVSDSPEGVSSEVSTGAENVLTPDPLVIPEDAFLGIEKYIKPCDGYVLKEHSSDVPVYSNTLSDYRVHVGVDVTGEVGTPVCAVIGGIVTDIYDDDMYGKTVCVMAKDGNTVKYSSLLPTVNADISVGAVISTGHVIGGIGDTALCEAVDPSHLHLEIHDADGNPLDPEDLISF